MKIINIIVIIIVIIGALPTALDVGTPIKPPTSEKTALIIFLALRLAFSRSHLDLAVRTRGCGSCGLAVAVFMHDLASGALGLDAIAVFLAGLHSLASGAF